MFQIILFIPFLFLILDNQSDRHKNFRKKIIKDPHNKKWRTRDVLFDQKQLHNELEGYVIYFESRDENSGRFKNATIIEHNNIDIIKTIISEYLSYITSYLSEYNLIC